MKHSSEKCEFGKKLEELRKRKRPWVSQTELAARMSDGGPKTTKNRISQFERGTKRPNTVELYLIQQKLELSLEESEELVNALDRDLINPYRIKTGLLPLTK
jgi:transcriptional regulator with XRE-family HTH domain